MSTAPSVAIERSAYARLAAVMASRPLLLALGITALLTMTRLPGTVDSDVAWQLWIASRIHAGANLYRDIIETNPPLWFWMALPLDRVASLLHLRIEAVLAVAIGCLVALALAATNRLIAHISPGRRCFLLTYGALVLLAMPWVHLGQREQLALIGALPYVALIAARREGRSVSSLLATLIGIAAAVGFALKHYFLIVPAMLELWLLVGKARDWRPVRPETVSILGVGAAYSITLLALEPDFLTTIVPLIRLAYGVFGAPSIKYMFGPFAVIALATLCIACVHARLLADRAAPFASALLVATVAFTATYFIQFKGWTYHAIPMLGCSTLALAALLAEVEKPPRALPAIAPALFVLPLVLAVDEQRHPALPSPDLLGAISGLQRGDTVGFLTTETAIPWSVTLQGGYRYASRYNGFWMMQAIIRNEQARQPDLRLEQLGRRIVSETVADFTCTPPKRIIVWRPRSGEDEFDILPFFLRDPNFSALLAHYRVRNRTSLETYELASAIKAPTGPCRTGI
jgi:hypothetical protein